MYNYMYTCMYIRMYVCMYVFANCYPNDYRKDCLVTQGGQDNESVCSSVSTVSEEDPFFDPKDIWEESFSSPSRGYSYT